MQLVEKIFGNRAGQFSVFDTDFVCKLSIFCVLSDDRDKFQDEELLPEPILENGTPKTR